ncbi:MAG: hypothetical protein ACRCVD_03455 [Halioglobus sp.]
MIPSECGIWIVMVVGLICISLSIFMAKWEKGGRVDIHRRADSDIWGRSGLGYKVPTIEEKEK